MDRKQIESYDRKKLKQIENHLESVVYNFNLQRYMISRTHQYSHQEFNNNRFYLSANQVEQKRKTWVTSLTYYLSRKHHHRPKSAVVSKWVAGYPTRFHYNLNLQLRCNNFKWLTSFLFVLFGRSGSLLDFTEVAFTWKQWQSSLLPTCQQKYLQAPVVYHCDFIFWGI